MKHIDGAFALFPQREDLSSVPALKESGLPKLDQELFNFR